MSKIDCSCQKCGHKWRANCGYDDILPIKCVKCNSDKWDKLGREGTSIYNERNRASGWSLDGRIDPETGEPIDFMTGLPVKRVVIRSDDGCVKIVDTPLFTEEERKRAFRGQPMKTQDGKTKVTIKTMPTKNVCQNCEGEGEVMCEGEDETCPVCEGSGIN